ncbi:hypothetical protein GN958_ATG22940 [Phytophthora infestans]|uniref:Uncharacterized protein n=1 Tax=Phytophthora infestans TaxID=4787 RepID=A0A8S9TMS6_PHYIN|nr:hypothetical protein GN958_ATG22940 [Phytophthora infestans]
MPAKKKRKAVAKPRTGTPTTQQNNPSVRSETGDALPIQPRHPNAASSPSTEPLPVIPDATIPAPLPGAFPPACGDDQTGLQAAYAKQVNTVSATSVAPPSRGREEPLPGTSSSATVNSAFNLDDFLRGFQPGGPTVPVSPAPPNNPRPPST